MNQQRLHIWVEGRVQGVGFRAFVMTEAHQLHLTGWVRNVGYDTVEAVAEGPRPQLDVLLDKIRQGPRAARVDASRVLWEEASGEFSAFRVRPSR